MKDEIWLNSSSLVFRHSSDVKECQPNLNQAQRWMTKRLALPTCIQINVVGKDLSTRGDKFKEIH